MKWDTRKAREIIHAAGGPDRVAEATGLGVRTVRRVQSERGRSPTYETAALIAEATGRSLDDFRRGR